MRARSTRRGFLRSGGSLAAGLGLGALWGCRGGAGAPGGPNIFLIVADALRADAVGRTLNGRELTPNINRLAESGVSFSNAFSAAPATKFSMASVYTGRYPPGHGVEYHMHTVPDCLTLPRFLGERGYLAAAATTNPFMAPEIGLAGTRRGVDFGFGAGFDFYRSIGREEMDIPTPGGEGEGGPREVERKMIPYVDGADLNAFFAKFLANYLPLAAAPGQPLFAYLHYMDSHQPWLKAGPTEFTGAFHEPAALKGRGVEEIFSGDVALIEKTFRGREREHLTPEEQARVRAVCYESYAYVDRCIGELADDLAARGLLENSLFIVTADHGDELFEHGQLGHGQNLYNPALRVPLVIGGGDRAPRTISARVTNAGLFPTLAGLFGEPLEGTTVPSFAGALEGSATGNRDLFASFVGQDKLIGAEGAEVMSVPPGEEGEREGEFLHFDLESDPAEKDPLAADEALLDRMRKLRYHSKRLGEKAGVDLTYSTYAWQNPFVELQNRLAREAVERGEMTEEEALRLKSTGAFIPEKETARQQGMGINEDALSEKQRRELRSLGYLH